MRLLQDDGQSGAGISAACGTYDIVGFPPIHIDSTPVRLSEATKNP